MQFVNDCNWYKNSSNLLVEYVCGVRAVLQASALIVEMNGRKNVSRQLPAKFNGAGFLALYREEK